MTNHEKAASNRLGEELCLDLAKKHAGHVEWNECDECTQLTKEFRTQCRVGAAAKEGIRRCMMCDAKSLPRFHYEQIAHSLYCRRSKPLREIERMTYSEKLAASLNCATHEEKLRCCYLAAAVQNPNYTTQLRQQAAAELQELREKIDLKMARLDRELILAAQSSASVEACKQIGDRSEDVTREVVVALASGSFRSRTERIFERVREFEAVNSKTLFEKPIVRYLEAKVRNATWAASLLLFEYLAIEWLRDARSLWRFLDAAFARWKEFENPKSFRHSSSVIHQTNGSKFFAKECKSRKTTALLEVRRLLLKQGAAGSAESDKLHGRLRVQKLRETSKSLAKRLAIPVTIR